MNSLAVMALSAALLLALALWYRTKPHEVRPILALLRMRRALGQSVEDGTRLHVALGDGDMLTPQGGASLAGLAVVRQLSQRTSASDRPTISSAGDPVLALLAQDTMEAGYQATGADELFQTTTARLAGLGAFGYAAGAMPMIGDEHVSAALLVGHFGAEAALLAEAAERQNALLLGASDDLSGQAVMFAASEESLVGEEMFAAPAYLGAGPWHHASLTTQDVLRWLIILALLGGSLGKLAGLL
jgi:hypothetical protein